MNRGKRAAWLLLPALLAVLVPSPALRFGGGIITAYGACVALAAAIGIRAFERLRIARAVRGMEKDGPVGVIFRVDAGELALWCIPAALAGARLLYVLMRPGYYLLDAGPLHALALWEGGFLLWGAAAGALLAAACLAKRRKADAAALLDDMAAPGLLTIALCRFAEGFAGEGLGPWVESAALARFPFAVQNAYGEWQLAVFLLEGLAALVIMAAVCREEAGGGRRIFTALLLYACAQIVLESLRMDGCLRIGFVRVSQAISALAAFALTALSAHRSGGRAQLLRRCGVAAACIALVGGIEWALDKTQIHNALLYGAMALLCALMAANALPRGRKERA